MGCLLVSLPFIFSGNNKLNIWVNFCQAYLPNAAHGCYGTWEWKTNSLSNWLWHHYMTFILEPTAIWHHYMPCTLKGYPATDLVSKRNLLCILSIGFLKVQYKYLCSPKERGIVYYVSWIFTICSLTVAWQDFLHENSLMTTKNEWITRISISAIQQFKSNEQ